MARHTNTVRADKPRRAKKEDLEPYFFGTLFELILFVDVFNKSLSWLRLCPVCGKSLQPIRWLCSDCRYCLVKRLRHKKRKFTGLMTHYYFFSWSREDLFMEKVVYSIKGGGLIGVEEFLWPFLYGLEFEAPDKIYYPSKGTKDHAYDLAKALAKYYQCPMEPLLIMAPGKQALRGVNQRKFMKLSGTTKPLGRKSLFVDDILTSGATAEAAYRALGRPAIFTVFSLFFRPMSTSL